MKHFIELYRDAGGKWARKIDKGRYHFIELVDWVDAVGEAEAKEAGHAYSTELHEVDVLGATEHNIEQALNSCGPDEDWIETLDAETKERVIAECLFDHGNKAPLGSFYGNGWTRLFRDARKLSYELTRDPAALEERLNRPVNALGSTAREYAKGDISSAMERGVREGNGSAKIIAKMHGVPDATIDAVQKEGPRTGAMHASVKLNRVPSKDPLAFSLGFMKALAGGGLDEPGAKREDLADAYIEGHKIGWSVRAGDTPMPEWAGGQAA